MRLCATPHLIPLLALREREKGGSITLRYLKRDLPAEKKWDTQHLATTGKGDICKDRTARVGMSSRLPAGFLASRVGYDCGCPRFLLSIPRLYPGTHHGADRNGHHCYVMINKRKRKRVTRVELVTSCLGSRRSAN